MKVLSQLVISILMMVSAVTAQQPVSLTLQKAVTLAIEKNTSVIQARNNVDASGTASLSALGSMLPTLSASASASQSQNWSPETGRTVFLPDGTSFVSTQGGFSRSVYYNAGLSSNLVLFNGFANTSNLSRARSNESATEFTYNRTQQGVIIQTYSLYLNVVKTYQLMQVSEDNLKRSQRQLERISESNKVGAVAIADVYRQQVQVGSDELSLIQAQANYEKSKADVVAYLGTEYNGEYTFDFTGIPTDIDTTEYASVNKQYSDYQALVNQAISARPDYLASLETLNASEASLTMARGNYYPTISANANYSWQSPDSFVFSLFRDYRGLSLSLNVSLPIFNGFSTQNQIEQASVQRKNADEQVRQNQRQVRVDIRKALLDLESAEKQVSVSQTTVKSAEMDRTIAEEKYNLGAGTLLDLLVATANYTNAVSNKVNAVVGYLMAKKQVEYTVGTISN
jgi:outer membrane protein